MSVTRRRFLAVSGGAAGAMALGCGGPPAPHGATSCSVASSGPGLSYCLVESTVVRVPNGAQLHVGQVALFNLDDNSAAIVARDERGFYALSGICTHQCCVLTVCDASCASVLTNPGNCSATPTGTLARQGGAFVCACHGSEFAADGTVLSGPATRNLPAVSLQRDGNDLLVDLAREASVSDRVA